MSGLRIGRVAPGDPALAHIVAQHAAHGDAHYPSESNHHLGGPEMAARGVRLFGGWLGDDLVAMAGYARWGDRQGEVKSMHVSQAARGQGAGAALLSSIVEAARAEGIEALWLETGSREASAAARRLYERHGFTFCGPFGTYRPDPESVFMRLDLPQP